MRICSRAMAIDLAAVAKAKQYTFIWECPKLLSHMSLSNEFSACRSDDLMAIRQRLDWCPAFHGFDQQWNFGRA